MTPNDDLPDVFAEELALFRLARFSSECLLQRYGSEIDPQVLGRVFEVIRKTETRVREGLRLAPTPDPKLGYRSYVRKIARRELARFNRVRHAELAQEPDSSPPCSEIEVREEILAVRRILEHTLSAQEWAIVSIRLDGFVSGYFVSSSEVASRLGITEARIVNRRYSEACSKALLKGLDINAAEGIARRYRRAKTPRPLR